MLAMYFQANVFNVFSGQWGHNATRQSDLHRPGEMDLAHE